MTGQNIEDSRSDLIRRIVIVGGGSSGWLCAAALSRVLGQTAQIDLIESDEIGSIGVGEATIPSIRTFNERIGIDEFDFVRETHATYKLGIEFAGWDRPENVYFHPFGEHGRETPEFKFHQLWLRLKFAAQNGECADPGAISDYNLCTVAAKLGRFLPPVGDASRILGSMRYAFHFDATLYGRYLRRLSEARGVKRIEGRVTAVNLRPNDGYIDSVTLRDGRSVAGDLFIDCSGFRSLLIGDALGTRFVDWTDYLPCDRAVAVACEQAGAPLPYTRATADRAGWRWRIPLQHRIGNGYVYASGDLADEEAADRLVSQLDGRPAGDPRLIKFRAGHRSALWVKNCVALGLAGGFIEPLESTSIHLVQTAIARLILLFPDRQFNRADIDQFNRLSILEYEQIRDFIILHYFATERTDTPFWRRCRALDIPDSLRHRIDLFKSKGRIFRFQDELFGDDSWLAVMLGQGILPSGFDPRVFNLPIADIVKNLAHLRQATHATASAMPTHAEFIARNGLDQLS